MNQGYSSYGIADDIITELSLVRWLFVIARSTSFTSKGQAIDVKQVGRELWKAVFVGQRVRLTAQLIDAEGGHHGWAEQYDRDLADVFAVQDLAAASRMRSRWRTTRCPQKATCSCVGNAGTRYPAHVCRP